MSNTIRKTQRKNKTNQVINWPSADEYFTIDSLIKTNEHMLTSSGSDITLRVKVMKCVKEEPKTVSVIGTLNVGKGRPQLAFAMKPIQKAALDKARADKIMLLSDSELFPVININKQSTPTPEPVKTTVTSVETVNA